jgi:hypothetical protein
MIHKLVWKYRAIRNPYIDGHYTTGVATEDNPITDAPDLQPNTPEYYGDEVYLTNRIMPFERDRCTRCGGREDLQAGHIELVPKGTFDPTVVHRIENLLTLCRECHNGLPGR